MPVPKLSEQEWEEFFESDEFDVTAFMGNNKKKETNKTETAISDREYEQREKAIEELFEKMR